MVGGGPSLGWGDPLSSPGGPPRAQALIVCCTCPNTLPYLHLVQQANAPIALLPRLKASVIAVGTATLLATGQAALAADLVVGEQVFNNNCGEKGTKEASQGGLQSLVTGGPLPGSAAIWTETAPDGRDAAVEPSHHHCCPHTQAPAAAATPAQGAAAIPKSVAVAVAAAAIPQLTLLEPLAAGGSGAAPPAVHAGCSGCHCASDSQLQRGYFKVPRGYKGTHNKIHVPPRPDGLSPPTSAHSYASRSPPSMFPAAACHTGGRNVVQAEKTLEKAALEQYLEGGFNTDAIEYQVTNGKNAMPAWGDRLSEEEIQGVAAYVFKQAEGNLW